MARPPVANPNPKPKRGTAQTKRFRYEPKKLQTRVRYPSRMPTRNQMRMAHDEGWSGWIRTVQDEIAVAEGCWFAVDQAQSVRTFFEKRLSHGKAPHFGLAFTLDDYQYEDIIGPIYGWRTSDNLRRYRSAYVHIPKKNGKTQLAAGIGIIELHYCPGSRVYIVATSEAQAYECYDESAGMVERNAHLSAYLKVLRSTGKIVWHRRNSSLATMAKAAASSEGKNASCPEYLAQLTSSRSPSQAQDTDRMHSQVASGGACGTAPRTRKATRRGYRRTSRAT